MDFLQWYREEQIQVRVLSQTLSNLNYKSLCKDQTRFRSAWLFTKHTCREVCPGFAHGVDCQLRKLQAYWNAWKSIQRLTLCNVNNVLRCYNWTVQFKQLVIQYTKGLYEHLKALEINFCLALQKQIDELINYFDASIITPLEISRNSSFSLSYWWYGGHATRTYMIMNF